MRSDYSASRFRLVAATVLCLLTLCAAPHVWAQATLENPQPDSFQSGIGLISGWACNAEQIEITFNGGPPVEAAYGTSRGDTQAACGDTNNGFGLPFNWNLLGDGVHTVQALADGIEFASVTVIVTTLGTEFLSGVRGEVPVLDFPTPGQTLTLRWQQGQQNFVITEPTAAPVGEGGTSGTAPHVLENPAPGSFQSGIGLISGWVCDAQTITISFDGGPPQEAAYGTSRGDTQTACGDTDNGFGLLFNWNLLGDGTHTVAASADGVEFARVDVTVTTLGMEFQRGLSREVIIPDFPEAGTDTVLQWQEAQQNFVISFAVPTLRLVEVTPTLRLPPGVSIPNLAVTSLHSDTTTEVRASPEPTLLLAEDMEGTVLLGLANMDGGLLGEGHGEVAVSVDSTAITLVALAAGYRLPDVDRTLVALILAHSQWSALTAALSALLKEDSNFLDRLFDYPETVALIRTIGTSLSGSASADVPPQSAAPLTFTNQSDSVLPDGVRKENFRSGSPWRRFEPWQWFGEAGVGIGDIVKDARRPPFLAQAIDWPALQAIANPNFADYALELYEGNEYLGWVHVPRNATVYDKLLNNSGAAYRILPPPFSARIDMVRFVRYRWSGFDTPRGTAISFLNTFKLAAAAFSVVENMSAYQRWLNNMGPRDAALIRAATCIARNFNVDAWVRDDTGANVRGSLRRMASQYFYDMHIAAVQCLGEYALETAGEALNKIIKTLLPNLALQLSNPVGWTLLAIRFLDEPLPVATSYFGGASVVDYHLGWAAADDTPPYLACVSNEDSCIPEAPENLRVTDIQETSVTLEWDEVLVPTSGKSDEEAEHYTVRIFTDKGVIGENMRHDTVTEVTGLEGGETYIFEVFATSKAGIEGEAATLLHKHPKPPEFGKTSYTFMLEENRYDHRGGVRVGTVNAIDPDGLNIIEYSLASGSTTKFTVDERRGFVRYVGRGEDYETGPREYGLTVRATLMGVGLSTDVRVTVKIEDDDELPYFEKESYEFTVQITDPRRNNNDRVFIGIVRAQDPEGEEVHHSLGSGTTARFSVSSDGRVTYCCYNTPLPGGEATHRLIVYAMNSDGTGPRIGVPVTVRLIGNSPPVFTAASYSFTLRENVAGPKAVGTVVARDPDVGDTVTYSLSTGDSTRFAVDSSTGVVSYIGAGEDYEERANFSLGVVATDTTGLTASTSVQIAVEDEEECIDELPQDVTIHSESYRCWAVRNCRWEDEQIYCGSTKGIGSCGGPDVRECVACIVTRPPPPPPTIFADPYDAVHCNGWDVQTETFTGEEIWGRGNPLRPDEVIQYYRPQG